MTNLLEYLNEAGKIKLLEKLVDDRQVRDFLPEQEAKELVIKLMSICLDCLSEDDLAEHFPNLASNTKIDIETYLKCLSPDAKTDAFSILVKEVPVTTQTEYLNWYDVIQDMCQYDSVTVRDSLNDDVIDKISEEAVENFKEELINNIKHM